MLADSAAYLEKQPTNYSRVQLEYCPSEALDSALHEFIKPEYRQELGIIALRSESYVYAPLLNNRQSLEHPPAWAQHLLQYKNALAQIATHQIRLAPIIATQPLESGALAVYFELLPSVAERQRLGQLAVGKWNRPYGAVAHIGAQLVDNQYRVATAHLRERLRSNEWPQLWVDHATLQDKSKHSVITTVLT